MPSSRGFPQPKDQSQVSHIAGRFFSVWATREAQEYWSGQPIPSPGLFPDPEVEPGSPALQADSLPADLPGHLLNNSLPLSKVLEKGKYSLSVPWRPELGGRANQVLPVEVHTQHSEHRGHWKMPKARGLIRGTLFNVLWPQCQC